MKRLALSVAAITGALVAGYLTGDVASETTGVAPMAVARGAAPIRKVAQLSSEQGLASPLALTGQPKASADEPANTKSLLGLGASLREVFEAEARDRRWAPQVEEHLKSELTGAFDILLDGEVSDLELECRKTTCEMSYIVDAGEEDRAFVYQQWIPLGDAVGPFAEDVADETGRVRVGVRLAFFEGTREVNQLIERYRTEFARRFPGGLKALREAIEEHGIDP